MCDDIDECEDDYAKDAEGKGDCWHDDYQDDYADLEEEL